MDFLTKDMWQKEWSLSFVYLCLFVLCVTEIFSSGSLPVIPEAAQLKQHQVENT